MAWFTHQMQNLVFGVLWGDFHLPRDVVGDHFLQVLPSTAQVAQHHVITNARGDEHFFHARDALDLFEQCQLWLVVNF